MACCLPTCARGFSFPDTGIVGIGSFWVFWFLLGILCTLGVLVFSLYPLVCTKFGSQRCALYWTRPLGGGRWGHHLCYPWGVYREAQKTTSCKSYGVWGFLFFKLYMLALMRRPSLSSYDACTVYQDKGASRRNCRQKECETSFSPKSVFLLSRNPVKRFWGLVLWYLWIGRARNPGPGSFRNLSVEVLNVGGWLTHGDFALNSEVDFLAITEHRLIPLLRELLSSRTHPVVKQAACGNTSGLLETQSRLSAKSWSITLPKLHDTNTKVSVVLE